MNSIKRHLVRISKLKKHVMHPLLHKIHKHHNISKKTLFYVKEYGPHTNIAKTIIKESIKILLLASIISSIGGLAIEHIKTIFVSIIPLIIILPTLNDMVGDYSTIISSKFSTMLHEGRLYKVWWKERAVKKLFLQISIIALFTTLISPMAALMLSMLYSYKVDIIMALKISLISVIDVAFIVSILFFVAIISGLYLYKKKEDPSNFLIPITTSIADFGNMFILAILVLIFF